MSSVNWACAMHWVSTLHPPSAHCIIPVHILHPPSAHCILPVHTLRPPQSTGCIPRPTSWGRGLQNCRYPMGGTGSPILPTPGGLSSPECARLSFWESWKGRSWFSSQVWKDAALRVCGELSRSPACDG